MQDMPTIFQQDGFDAMIYTADHTPMHVHIKKAGAVLVVNLDAEGGEPTIRENQGMKRSEARRAFDLVKERRAELVEG